MYYSFPRVNGEANFTGYNSFFFLPKSAFTFIPEAVNATVNLADFVFSGSSDWFLGYSIHEKLFFKDDPVTTTAGVTYPYGLSATAPVDKPEYLSLFEQMVHDEFIVLIQDNNKRMKMLGTLEKGVRFIYKREGVGYTFEFKGEYSCPAPFFSGVITVDGTDYGMILTPAGTYIRAARWFFAAGAPVVGVGNEGDMYLDITTTNYYQKTGGAWILVSQMVDQEAIEYAFHIANLMASANY